MTQPDALMPVRRAFWRLVALPAVAAALLAITGCATRPPASGDAAAGGPWSGRLALRIDASPPQSLAAGFELRGQPESGELVLSTPIGSTLAALDWAPGTARLRAGGKVEDFDSLDALVTRATGAAIPVRALFDWLAGTPTPVPGWEADLSRLAEGRLVAKRHAPQPPTELRIVLDR